jgi:hypothetical protein
VVVAVQRTLTLALPLLLGLAVQVVAVRAEVDSQVTEKMVK